MSKKWIAVILVVVAVGVVVFLVHVNSSRGSSSKAGGEIEGWSYDGVSDSWIPFNK